MTSDQTRLQQLRHARIRRAKHLLKWMPRKANLDRYPIIKWFAKAARKRPYLWSFKVPSCTPAFYLGSVIAFLPLMGVQIVLALVAALFLRANLPIMIGLQGISNPVTVTILWPLNFLIGRKTMDFFGIGAELNPIMSGMHATFLGGVILGLAVGAILDLLYRVMVYEAGKLNLVLRPEKSGSDKPGGENSSSMPPTADEKTPDDGVIQAKPSEQ